MVNSLRSRRVPATPLAAPRVNPSRTHTTPLFSVKQTLPSPVAAGAEQLMASATPPRGGAGSARQGKSGAARFRPLFIRSPAAAHLVVHEAGLSPASFAPSVRT